MTQGFSQRALMALSPSRIKTTASAISADWDITPVSLSESGLAMLQLRDGALEERFNLGELPLSVAHLRIQPPGHRAVEGAAAIMSDDRDLVESMAILDAVYAHALPGAEQIQALLEEGHALLAEADRRRNAMLTRTQVDFSLLDSVEDADAD